MYWKQELLANKQIHKNVVLREHFFMTAKFEIQFQKRTEIKKLERILQKIFLVAVFCVFVRILVFYVCKDTLCMWSLN